MSENLLNLWRELSQDELVMELLGLGKLALLTGVTLLCIHGLKKWLVRSRLDACYTLTPYAAEKSTPASTWLSTAIANGLCLSLAAYINDHLILKSPIWSRAEYDIIVRFWGTVLLYLLLTGLLKNALTAVGHFLSQLGVEQFIENYMTAGRSPEAYRRPEPQTGKVIHDAIFALFFFLSWMIGILLMIDFFNIQLLSVVAERFLISAGHLVIALVFILVVFQSCTRLITGKVRANLKQTSMIVACCLLFGAILLGGLSDPISIISWLLFLALIVYFIIQFDKGLISDLVAGLILRLKTVTAQKDPAHPDTDPLQIIRTGLLESEVYLPSGKQAKISNTKLLAIRPVKSAGSGYQDGAFGTSPCVPCHQVIQALTQRPDRQGADSIPALYGAWGMAIRDNGHSDAAMYQNSSLHVSLDTGKTGP